MSEGGVHRSMLLRPREVFGDRCSRVDTAPLAASKRVIAVKNMCESQLFRRVYKRVRNMVT